MGVLIWVQGVGGLTRSCEFCGGSVMPQGKPPVDPVASATVTITRHAGIGLCLVQAMFTLVLSSMYATFFSFLCALLVSACSSDLSVP